MRCCVAASTGVAHKGFGLTRIDRGLDDAHRLYRFKDLSPAHTIQCAEDGKVAGGSTRVARLLALLLEANGVALDAGYNVLFGHGKAGAFPAVASLGFAKHCGRMVVVGRGGLYNNCLPSNRLKDARFLPNSRSVGPGEIRGLTIESHIIVLLSRSLWKFSLIWSGTRG